MAEYLTEDAIFTCSGCPYTMIRAREPHAKTRLKHVAVLTENAKLQVAIPGNPCQFLTAQAGGTPTPCAFPGLNGSDLSGRDNKHTCTHATLLTNKVHGRCPLAGTSLISVKVPSNTPGCFKQFDGTTLSNYQAEDCIGQSKASNESILSTAVESVKFSQVENISHISTTENIEKFTSCGPEEKPVLRCDTCIEADSCEFLNNMRKKELIKYDLANLKSNYKARIENTENKNEIFSPILNNRHLAHKAYIYAQNTEKNFKNIYPHTQEIWNYPAHHIICGEFFRDNKQLNTLARIFDYNMNCADNCIMLLGKENKGEKFSNKSSEEKHTYSFERMAWGRMQWHSGGHRYNLDKIQAAIAKQMILRKYANKEEIQQHETEYSSLGIKCYFELVNEKILTLLQRYQRNKTCPKIDFQRKKDQFHALINRIAHDIREKISKFYQKPHRSHPWFVSKEAWIYAFMLPHCIHLVSILSKDGGLMLEKFNITRYAKSLKIDENNKGKLFSIMPLKNASGSASMLWHRADGSTIIKQFCADAAYFALGKNLENDCAGFQIKENIIYRLNDIYAGSALKELEQNQSKLLGHIQNTLEKTETTLTPLQRMSQKYNRDVHDYT